MKPISIIISKDGISKKYRYLIRGYLVEVLTVMHTDNKLIVCFPTMIKCKVGCAFCVSTKSTMQLKLTTDEMYSLIRSSEKDIPENIQRLYSAMGEGEPINNLTNVINLFTKLRNESESAKLALSTTGIDHKKLNKLLLQTEKLNVKIQYSLHSCLPYDLMPYRSKHNLEILNKHKLRVEYNVTLLNSINDSYDHANAIINSLSEGSRIKITPYNKHDGSKYDMSTKTNEFVDILRKSNKFNIEVYQTQGQDIKASCGQMTAIDIKETYGLK